jgi:hypothetical protein
MERTLRRGKFSLDIHEDVYEGYTYGQTWNGWACPYFAKDVADSIAAQWNAPGMSASYEAMSDTYIFSDPDNDGGEPYIVHGDGYRINGTSVRLYPIGNGYWIWDEDRARPEEEKNR